MKQLDPLAFLKNEKTVNALVIKEMRGRVTCKVDSRKQEVNFRVAKLTYLNHKLLLGNSKNNSK